MGRKPRLLLEKSYYHIFNRVNNHRSVNLSEGTFKHFILLLKCLHTEYKLEIYAYCLMTTHYHILIKTDTSNLDKAMKYFGENYARNINKHTNATGPVFTSRYKAKYISDDAYFLQVLKYIHLNPVEANICTYFEDYQWSSIQDYNNADNSVTNIKEVLNKFASYDDFIHYHHRGNTKQIKHFYNKKQIPNILSDETVK